MKTLIATMLLIGSLTSAALAQYPLPPARGPAPEPEPTPMPDPAPEPEAKAAPEAETADDEDDDNLAAWVDTLTGIADELAEAAPACRDDGTRPPSRLMRRINAMNYTPTSVRALDRVLRGLSSLPDGDQYFVTHQLMRPLQYADAETLEAAESLIDKCMDDLSYSPPPEWTPGELSLIGSGQAIDETDEEFETRLRRGEDETDEEFEERRTAAEDMLEAKLQEEAALTFGNTNVQALRSTCATLLLRMNTESRDEDVITLLQAAMEAKDSAYTDILTAIRAVGTAMTQERAEWFYDELKAMWPDDPNAKDAFIDYTKLNTASLKNPTFATKKIKPFTLCSGRSTIWRPAPRSPR